MHGSSFHQSSFNYLSHCIPISNIRIEINCAYAEAIPTSFSSGDPLAEIVMTMKSNLINMFSNILEELPFYFQPKHMSQFCDALQHSDKIASSLANLNFRAPENHVFVPVLDMNF